MAIKCARCNKDIARANARNAKYIVNPDDVLTHGQRNISVFRVMKKDAILKTFEKLNHAEVDRDDILLPLKAQRKTKEKDAKRLMDEFVAIPNLPERAAERDSKSALINVKQNEIDVLDMDIKEYYVKEDTDVKTVPKTAIICREEECQNINDIIIWG